MSGGVIPLSGCVSLSLRAICSRCPAWFHASHPGSQVRRALPPWVWGGYDESYLVRCPGAKIWTMLLQAREPPLPGPVV